jgi:hypothetical protein
MARCEVVGHGVEADGQIYCCAHCATEMGKRGLRDRAEHQASPASGRSM